METQEITMTTQQVADRLVELCRKGENLQVISELYDQDVISKEMIGTPNEFFKGKENIIKKNQKWYASVEEFHGGSISDPLVAENHFCCTMKMDCTFKERGRMKMEELCVYNVTNGKIVQEQFFYTIPGQ